MVRVTLVSGRQFEVEETLYWVATTLASKRGEGYFTLRKADGLRVTLDVSEIESAEEVLGAAMDVPQGVEPAAEAAPSIEEFDAGRRAPTEATPTAV